MSTSFNKPSRPRDWNDDRERIHNTIHAGLNYPTFGTPSYPRSNDPSMAELLQWQAGAPSIADYKSGDRVFLKHADDYELIRTRIKKADHDFITENQDNYLDYWHDDVHKRSPEKFRDPDEAKRIAAARAHLRSSYDEHFGRYPIRSNDAVHDAVYMNYLEKLGRTPQEIAILLRERAGAGGGEPTVAAEPKRQSPVKVQEQGTGNPEPVAHATPARQKVESEAAVIQDSLRPPSSPEDLEKQKRKLAHIWKNSRWGANTTLQTYFGRPAFEAYGRANNQPHAVGAGIFYGQHLHTHNVNPHRIPNQPPTKQIFAGSEQLDRPRTAVISRKPLPEETKVTKDELDANRAFKPTAPEILKRSETPQQHTRVANVRTQAIKEEIARARAGNVLGQSLPARGSQGSEREGDGEETRANGASPIAKPSNQPSPPIARYAPLLVPDISAGGGDPNLAGQNSYPTFAAAKAKDSPQKATSFASTIESDRLVAQDPKNYKNVPWYWLQPIPHAGQSSKDIHRYDHPRWDH